MRLSWRACTASDVGRMEHALLPKNRSRHPLPHARPFNLFRSFARPVAHPPRSSRKASNVRLILPLGTEEVGQQRGSDGDDQADYHGPPTTTPRVSIASQTSTQEKEPEARGELGMTFSLRYEVRIAPAPKRTECHSPVGHDARRHRNWTARSTHLQKIGPRPG